MITRANDQAFPSEDGPEGLSKREYFAALAMQGLLAGHYEYFRGNSDVSVSAEIAKYAVYYADDLIKRLNETNK